MYLVLEEISLSLSKSSMALCACFKVRYLLPSKSDLILGVCVIVTISGYLSDGVLSIIQFLCLYFIVVILFICVLILLLLHLPKFLLQSKYTTLFLIIQVFYQLFYKKKPTMWRPSFIVGGSDEHFRIGESWVSICMLRKTP